MRPNLPAEQLLVVVAEGGIVIIPRMQSLGAALVNIDNLHTCSCQQHLLNAVGHTQRSHKNKQEISWQQVGIR